VLLHYLFAEFTVSLIVNSRQIFRVPSVTLVPGLHRAGPAQQYKSQ